MNPRLQLLTSLCFLILGLLAPSVLAAEQPPLSPLSLQQALSQIIEKSTAVQAQKANLKIAEIRSLNSKLAFLPDIRAELTQAKSATGEEPFTAQDQKWTLGATAELNLFRFGADTSGWRAASHDLAGAVASVDAETLKAEEQGATALFLKIQRQNETRVLSHWVETETKLEKIAQERYEHGLLPLQEVEKVTVDRSNAEARLAGSQINEIEANASLEKLLGEQLIEEIWPWKKSLASWTNLPKLDQEIKALPDWKVSNSSLNAELERLDQRWRASLPSLDATLSYGKYYPFSQESYPSWSATATLSIPLFDRLSHINDAREQKQTVAIAEAKLDQQARDLRSDAKLARETFQKQLNTALDREKTLALSQRLFEDAQKRFQMGRLSSNDLSIEQSRLIDSELYAIQGWSNAHQAAVRLCHSLGKRILDETQPCFLMKTKESSL